MAWQDPNGQSEWRDAYGQYGQDPYAQDPYSQYAYGHDPYGQNAYAQDPYAQYDYGAYPPGTAARSGLTVGALVANIVAAIFCCGIGVAWIPGIILASVALSRNTTDPESARKLTIGAWVCFVIDIVLTVVGFVVLGMVSDSHSSGTY